MPDLGGMAIKHYPVSIFAYSAAYVRDSVLRGGGNEPESKPGGTKFEWSIQPLKTFVFPHFFMLDLITTCNCEGFDR